MQLYKITEQYHSLMQVIEDTDKTVDDFDLVLQEIQDNLEHKVENIAKLCLSLQASAEAIKKEEIRLEARRSALERKDDWLRRYLQGQMLSVGVERVKRDTVTVTIRQNPPSVEVLEPDTVPLSFCRIIPEQRVVDKRSILDYFKATGELVDGVAVITDRKRIEIK